MEFTSIFIIALAATGFAVAAVRPIFKDFLREMNEQEW